MFEETCNNTTKTIAWAAFGGSEGVRRQELLRFVSEIYLWKRAGCTHVAFDEKVQWAIEALETTQSDLPAYTRNVW